MSARAWQRRRAWKRVAILLHRTGEWNNHYSRLFLRARRRR